jgi:hypothetical protein
MRGKGDRVFAKAGVDLADHSGLSLFYRGEHAFTEIEAFPLTHTPIQRESDLAHLNGEIAYVITELFHGTLLSPFSRDTSATIDT